MRVVYDTHALYPSNPRRQRLIIIMRLIIKRSNDIFMMYFAAGIPGASFCVASKYVKILWHDFCMPENLMHLICLSTSFAWHFHARKLHTVTIDLRCKFKTLLYHIVLMLFPAQKDPVPEDYFRRDPEHKTIYRFIRNLFHSAQLTAECAIVTLVSTALFGYTPQCN